MLNKYLLMVVVTSFTFLSDISFSSEVKRNPDIIGAEIHRLNHVIRVDDKYKENTLWESEMFYNRAASGVQFSLKVNENVNSLVFIEIVDVNEVVKYREKLSEYTSLEWTPLVDSNNVSLRITGEAQILSAYLVAISFSFPSAIADSPIGGVNFEPIANLNSDLMYRNSAKSVARLLLTSKPSAKVGEVLESYPCTGFLVSNSLLMTSRHCIQVEEQCSHFIALFNYEENSNEAVRGYRCKNIEYANKILDVVIVRLKKNAGKLFGYLTFDTNISLSKLVLIQHPNGMSKRVVRDEDCKVISKFEQGYQAIGVKKSLVNEIAFGHGCDTDNGSSGSPVLNYSGKVIGVHQQGKGELEFNRAIRIDKIVECLDIVAVSDNFRINTDKSICRNEA